MTVELKVVHPRFWGQSTALCTGSQQDLELVAKRINSLGLTIFQKGSLYSGSVQDVEKIAGVIKIFNEEKRAHQLGRIVFNFASQFYDLNPQGSIFQQVIIQNKAYIFAETRKGCVIQSKEDWDLNKFSGLYVALKSPAGDLTIQYDIITPELELVVKKLVCELVTLSAKQGVVPELQITTDEFVTPSAEKWFNSCRQNCTPHKNKDNLASFYRSKEFYPYAKTAVVYTNRDHLSIRDEQRLLECREPANISGAHLYDQSLLEKGYGYKQSCFYGNSLTEKEGKLFRANPNSVCIYSETPLWRRDSLGDSKAKPIPIACLSIPAPALDSKSQPHYPYYCSKGFLDKQRYEKEMEFLAKTVVTATTEQHLSAFGGKGISRVVIPFYGQGAFLGALSEKDANEARKIFVRTVVNAWLGATELKDLPLQFSLYNLNNPLDRALLYHCLKRINEKSLIGATETLDFPLTQAQEEELTSLQKSHHRVTPLIGDILKTAPEHSLIINAWDPHSMPGNGCDGDLSFDGAMGSGTAITVLQNPHVNFFLRSATPNSK